MTADDSDARLRAAGYMPIATDPTGRTLLAPDGHRVVTVELALAEIEGRDS